MLLPNLGFNTTDTSLWDAFSAYGTVLDVSETWLLEFIDLNVSFRKTNEPRSIERVLLCRIPSPTHTRTLTLFSS